MAVVHMAGQQTPLGLSSMEMAAMMHEAAGLVTACSASGDRRPSGPKSGKRPPRQGFQQVSTEPELNILRFIRCFLADISLSGEA